MSASMRSRLQMYLLVTLICGASALAIEFLLTSTRDLRGYANRQIDSAVHKAVQSEVAQATRAAKQP